MTAKDLSKLCARIERDGGSLDADITKQVGQLGRAAKRAMAGRDLLFAENHVLLKQNHDATRRQSIKAKVVGHAKVMSYHDLVEAERRRDEKEAAQEARRYKTTKRSGRAISPPAEKMPCLSETEAAEREIDAMGLRGYCSILEF